MIRAQSPRGSETSRRTAQPPREECPLKWLPNPPREITRPPREVILLPRGRIVVPCDM